MKEIRLKQYIEITRTVAVFVEENETELDAAKKLNGMPLCLDDDSEMPMNAAVVKEWGFISDRGIENSDGETILSGEEC